MPTPTQKRIKPWWVALGFILTGLGFLGLILPGLPGTIWFILAAGAFSRGDPRWEAWLLSRPVVGQMILDYRTGMGMPLRAKWIACSCIVLAVGFSLPRIPILIGQIVWILVGLAGIAYITLKVPTKEKVQALATNALQKQNLKQKD